MSLTLARVKVLESITEPRRYSEVVREVRLADKVVWQTLRFLLDRGLIEKTTSGLYHIAEEGRKALVTVQISEMLREKAQRAGKTLIKIEKTLSNIETADLLIYDYLMLLTIVNIIEQRGSPMERKPNEVVARLRKASILSLVWNETLKDAEILDKISAKAWRKRVWYIASMLNLPSGVLTNYLSSDPTNAEDMDMVSVGNIQKTLEQVRQLADKLDDEVKLLEDTKTASLILDHVGLARQALKKAKATR